MAAIHWSGNRLAESGYDALRGSGEVSTSIWHMDVFWNPETQEETAMQKLVLSTVVMALALLTNVQMAAAQSSDEAAIASAVETYRKAMLAADRSQFETIGAEQMSYGHSGGRIETKAQFIAGATSGKSAWKFIKLTDHTTQIIGNDAIVRHLFAGENASAGKTNAIKIGILVIWQKQGGSWQLLARQAYKI